MSWTLIWPILVVIGANSLYHVAAKAMPAQVDTFASLTVCYLCAALVSLALFFITGRSKNLLVEIGNMNWTSIVLGVSIVFLEFGYVCVYRSGWDISRGSLVASISVACVLLVVGLVFFRETINARQIIGMAVCFIGLILVS